MADFTFLEVHLHGDIGAGESGGSGLLSFGRSKSEGDSEWTDVDVTGEEEDQGSGTGLAVLVGLALLVGLAYAYRRFTGGSEEQVELEEFEEVAPRPS
ncbi:MAG: hypothetical protein ABEJ28_01510 [Salinigranum sp.]